MIAATDALRWVPHGRLLGHPGQLAGAAAELQECNDPLAEQLRSIDLSDEVKEWWYVRAGKGEHEGSEEELHVCGKKVVWSRGLHTEWKVVRSFTVEANIMAACWGRFHPGASLHQLPMDNIDNSFEGVCIIDGQNIYVYAEDGTDYVTSVQFSMRAVWPIHLGVLLEMEKVDEIIIGGLIPAQIPRLFSLQHPYDDVNPVITKHAGRMGSVHERGRRVVFVSEKPPICMLYDADADQHSVWYIRRATMEESCSTGRNATGVEPTEAGNSGDIFATFLSTQSNLPWSSGANDGNRGCTSPQQSFRPSVSARLGSSINPPFAGVNMSHNSSASTRYHSLRQPSLSESLGGSPSFSRPPRRESSIDSRSPLGATMIIEEPLNPIYAEICLDHLWTESARSEHGGFASRAFIATDLVGTSRLCYVIPKLQQLLMVRLSTTNQQELLIFGVTSSLPAVDAAPLTELNMVVVLDKLGGLALYSGTQLVSKVLIPPSMNSMPTPGTPRAAVSSRQSVYMDCTSNELKRSSLVGSTLDTSYFSNVSCPYSPVLPPQSPNPFLAQPQQLEDFLPSKLVRLRDATSSMITLEYGGGHMLRISLPQMSSSMLVYNALSVLRIVLPCEEATGLLAKWYCVRNAPGTQDITDHSEWQLFASALLGLLGFDVDKLRIFKDKGDIGTMPQEKRKRKSDSGSKQDWEWLVSHHQSDLDEMGALLGLKVPSPIKVEASKTETGGTINKGAPLYQEIRRILYYLHLLYEDLKLDSLAYSSLPDLAQLLHLLASELQQTNYSDHYWRDFPTKCKPYSAKELQISEDLLREMGVQAGSDNVPPNIMLLLYNLTQLNVAVDRYPVHPSINLASKDVIELMGLLTHGIKNPQMNVTALTLPMTSFGTLHLNSKLPTWSRETDERVPANSVVMERAVILMVEKGLKRMRLKAMPPSIAICFLNAMARCRALPPTNWPKEAFSLIRREDLAQLCQKNYSSDKSATHYSTGSSVNSVTTEPQADENDDGMEGMDTEIQSLLFPKDQRLGTVRRLLQSARPVLISVIQRPEVTDHDFIEEQERVLYAMCTRTMALPIGRGMFTLGTVRPVVMEPLSVPRLCLTGRSPKRGATIDLSRIEVVPNMNLWPLFHNGVAAGLRICPGAEGIDSTWITYNKQKGGADNQTEHAGFLMALGLNGHLSSLDKFRIYEYLQKCHEMTSVGLLLGIAASKRGSSDLETSKTIRTICLHIEAMLPPTALELNIAQNVQVAALLGLGLLYQGSGHRHITEVLLSEIGRPPGPEMENSVDRESYSLAAGLALGLVVLGKGDSPMTELGDLSIPDTLYHYMVGTQARRLTGSHREKYRTPSYQIREGDAVNVHVTCPGATMALGMLYFATGNEAVAKWMEPPDTQHLLDFIRPDFLLLRVLARGLILWDKIEPTEDWITSNIPKHIRPQSWTKPRSEHESGLDPETMNQSYYNILAGACMVLGLRFAGSNNKRAYSLLLSYLRQFISHVHRSSAEMAGKSTLETCINVVLLACAMVVAGTGQIEVLRLVRFLRVRVGVNHPVVTYGSHLATHMALGLLFLGGGRYTLSTSPPAVAALLCSLFPKFPTHSNDNRYHLQAFRHFYVLAAEPRLLLPRCIDSGAGDFTRITVFYWDSPHYKDAKSIVMAPCLLPELKYVKEVLITDDRFWPIRFQRHTNWDQLEQALKSGSHMPVKRRAGCLPRKDDPRGFRTTFAQVLSDQREMPWLSKLESILAFSSTSPLVGFAKQYLDEVAGESYHEVQRKERLRALTYECCVQDKASVLPFALISIKNVEDVEAGIPNLLGLRDCKLLHSVVQFLYTDPLNKCILFSKETSYALISRCWTTLDKLEPELMPLLQRYLRGCEIINIDDRQSRLLAAYLSFFDLPTPQELLKVPRPWTGLSLMSIANLKSAAVDKLLHWQHLRLV